MEIKYQNTISPPTNKGYSIFPKAPALLEPHRQIVLCQIQDTH